MKNIIIILSLFISNTFLAQNFQGEASYKSHRKIDLKLDSTLNSEMQNNIMEMMKKQFEKNYTLSFNKNESLYKVNESLESPQQAGVQIMMIGGGESDILYKNTKENRFTNQTDLMGKVFLIQDSLQKQDWTLASETKNIGDYTCYKATKTISQENATFNFDENDQKSKKETITITAWYTPQIPVNHGPSIYQGLPGLILEINDGSETLICNQITLNAKKEIKITEPNKGKIITQTGYETIMKKKMKEMENRYQNNRDKGDGFEIRIGG